MPIGTHWSRLTLLLPLGPQSLLERSVNSLLSESGLLPSLQEVFLASWFPAPQNRKLGLTGCELRVNVTMKYYSAIKKNSFESVLMKWMKLEPIIQSEVSQKDKDHYSILTHIYGI